LEGQFCKAVLVKKSENYLVLQVFTATVLLRVRLTSQMPKVMNQKIYMKLETAIKLILFFWSYYCYNCNNGYIGYYGYFSK
jgi:hypothetical protein